MAKRQPWLHEPKIVYQPKVWILAVWAVLTVFSLSANLELALQNYELHIQNKVSQINK